MSKEKSKPTLEEIAALSEVSVATVSRVINSSSPVSKDLELRVKHAMQELGFEPKQSKVRTRPYVIAFIIPDLMNPALTAVTMAAQEEAEKLDLCLVVFTVTEKPGRQRQNLQLLKHFSFDGVIMLHGQIEPDDLLEEFHLHDVPIVVLGKMVNSPHVHCINTDRANGMYQAAKYLISLNHTEIGYLSGPPEWELSQVRLQGIQRALSEEGLTLNPKFHRWCFPTIEWGFQVTSSILRLPAYPTAIIAFNDLLAIGTLHAIRTFGLTVPDDISVVGFDDIYLTPHTNPPLTTISQPQHRVGQLAIEKIYNSLNGYETDMGGFTLLECPLVVRESTAPRKTKIS
ncbi:transcriptional regulator, LacI family [Candidatus Vecturithrix granuli]|uniref:Transcriptional regulator, LacI family n=1 Tax=Vecturithrix granuli TaxID=1499967 RepID=A0A081C184_VECG1|nr:transcriptional regulator, LacI family [Candidatus Vecturithrix granuli]